VLEAMLPIAHLAISTHRAKPLPRILRAHPELTTSQALHITVKHSTRSTQHVGADESDDAGATRLRPCYAPRADTDTPMTAPRKSPDHFTRPCAQALLLRGRSWLAQCTPDAQVA
jgi:hypothetical protein